MPLMTRHFSFSRTISLGSFVIWLFTGALAIALLAAFQYRSGLSELSDWTRATDTFLAEKLAQHDAHMTALAAVIRMSPAEPSASVQGLAQSVTAFYPRITDIATIRIDGTTARAIAYGNPNGPVIEAGQSAGDLPILGKPGETTIRPIPERHAYDIYKLVEAGRLLRLRISAGALLGTDRIPPGYSVSLSLGDTALFTQATSGTSILDVKTSLSASNPGQPLHLLISRSFRLGELFPVSLVIPLLIGSAILVWLGVQYRNASREKRRQELRATLLEQEARLAHAGRVNALGEMASGIAHELTQPVAAMLSQSQAARRALTLDRADILEQALDANIREAKRAGDILGRMRAYISGAEARIEKMTLAEALNGALRLVETDLARQGIRLETAIAEAPCIVAIDVISFQQVIHNLIRNAADAVAGWPEARIALEARKGRGQAIIAISDNGPGIDPALLDRIFEPFFTTKPDGMGLGLPLCVRLIEKMDGTIEARNDGGACFTIRLPCGGAA
ncbi:His Kinase A (phospho-acceptor) domain-containing protein [Rhizobium miluonense]|uniref:histidine kinase n=1 Tax=Rhizobium miluonense TaxID=411945 RepID=A0A1C3XEE7_9HYPH|nr:His Kinase A (phospho-acceptor) domain-containing protein [Rhizobium miluonense]